MNVHATIAAAVAVLIAAAAAPGAEPVPDWRNIRTGREIPSEGYADQPYVVELRDDVWLCVLTTGKGAEGEKGQHIVATTSKDQGKTWSPLVDIEPAGGPEASWAVPCVDAEGRVYVFY
ncbi:MAG TPA: sialidase family protein, partial [Phycisphaerae bacterium]|nr:sialidase family protein [Phycisphaerae bacterium]